VRRLRIAYFVHDLANPAVAHRVQMLQAGGAEVVLLGFSRNHGPVTSVAGVEAVDLGGTSDARLIRRAGSVLRALAGAPRWSRKIAGAETILARNLEMLVLAQAARRFAAPKAALAYEVLDVHRLMLGGGFASRALRWLERLLMHRTSVLVISSPAFVTGYFEPRRQSRESSSVVLVENKVLSLNGPPTRSGGRPPGPPWRIGWCGMIRCQRSLDILADLTRRSPGLVEVEVHGRPFYAAFRDFDAQVTAAPGVHFHGPYAQAALPGIYDRMHFVWAIDYYEEGLNSDWLLPWRLYEGQLNGAVPIALRGVETGRWLARHGAGLLIDDAAAELAPAMAALNPDTYAELARRTAAVPLTDLVCDRAECASLVRALLAPAGRA
jgi:succinoglycan biosynthesis protein ExoL